MLVGKQMIRAGLEVADRPFFEPADDNTFVNKQGGREFLRAITPLGIEWFTETDISVAEDEELLDLLAGSGCRQVLLDCRSLPLWVVLRADSFLYSRKYKKARAHHDWEAHA